MMNHEEPARITTYKIPRIEVYEVTEDELARIEETHGQVGLDMNFMIAFGTLAASILLSLVTSSLVEMVRGLFWLGLVACGVLATFFGIRYWKTRNKVPDVLRKIRGRKEDPQLPGAAGS